MKQTFTRLVLVFMLAGCASGDEIIDHHRDPVVFDVLLTQTLVVPSSVLRFQLPATSSREASGASIRVTGNIGDGVILDSEFYRPVQRDPVTGDLVIELRVFDGLWQEVDPDPTKFFVGAIQIEVDDPIGVLGHAVIEEIRLEFRSEVKPEVSELPTAILAYPNENLVVKGDGFLRPEEGTTWAIVEDAVIRYDDATSRPISNARVALLWDGSRSQAFLPVSPSLFGVRVGEFKGAIRFENDLTTGQVFTGTLHSMELELRRPRVDTLSPAQGSRGQKVEIAGRGFVRPNEDLGYGMYFLFEGEFVPDNPDIPILAFTGSNALVRVPWRVVGERVIEQDVWYSVTPNGLLNGLGATPGVFTGTITPVVFDVSSEQRGESWRGTFRVLPTKQVVHLKFLPGFTSALGQYGLAGAEDEVRERIKSVLMRDYAGIHIEFRDSPPDDFINFTTIEIGGPDPSGLQNFGYDNSFNDGGKDLGNLYLADYLGGVNRHSQDAGYLPYGGVFIESFIAFSPRLFPDNFGTSPAFDDVMSPFMPALGGKPIDPSEYPAGPRSAAIADAVEMLGNLTGHTASHEIGHSVGLAFFPETVEGYEERFHNDPPGLHLIMDGGSDRPFEERAEILGEGPAAFSTENVRYLKRILPLP